MEITGYNIEKESLNTLLSESEQGATQLPDFQRGWVWDDERVRSLLASVSLGYPIGAVMMLATGSESVRFAERTLEGAPNANANADRLVLDGQQRLTSLFQALLLNTPVMTRDAKGKPVERWYYINMSEALDEHADREDAVISLPRDRKITRNFGREIVKDYSTPDREYEEMLFPLSQVFQSYTWRRNFQKHWKYDDSKMELWDRFEEQIVKRFEQYQVPVIELGKDTPKEAVCQVFEKVNTGGVTLTVFELLTATFAADDFQLRPDWEARKRKIRKHSILSKVSNTDFIQAVTLLATYHRRQEIQGGSEPDRTLGIGCKRKDMLRLTLCEYLRWADPLMSGFHNAARFLHSQYLFEYQKMLPYGSQLIPLAAILTILDSKWDSHQARERLAKWYWCGVLGELYGGSIDTRFSRDLPEVVEWIQSDGPEPSTVYDAEFSESRLLTLRTRRSAAYKGIYALLLRGGACDWLSGEESAVQSYFDEHIDIHHIFPQKWCKDNGIKPNRCDSIINKTPLTARTNRSIGGRAPSEYLGILSRNVPYDSLGQYVSSHNIDAQHLWQDDFDSFFASRTALLLAIIRDAMGKAVLRDGVRELDAKSPMRDEYELVHGDSMGGDDLAD